MSSAPLSPLPRRRRADTRATSLALAPVGLERGSP